MSKSVLICVERNSTGFIFCGIFFSVEGNLVFVFQLLFFYETRIGCVLRVLGFGLFFPFVSSQLLHFCMLWYCLLLYFEWKGIQFCFTMPGFSRCRFYCSWSTSLPDFVWHLVILLKARFWYKNFCPIKDKWLYVVFSVS